MQPSLKNQTSLLCQNNLYLYTNKEIIINLEDFALIVWSILVLGYLACTMLGILKTQFISSMCFDLNL